MDIEDIIARAIAKFRRESGEQNGSGNGDKGNTPAPKTEKSDDQHPVLKAALAVGIETAEQFNGLLEKAEQLALVKPDADAYAEDVNAAFKREAIRKYGAEPGLVKFANYGKLALADKKTLTAEWQGDSDEKYGIGENGQAAKRDTAPAQLPNGTNAEGANTTGGNHSGNGGAGTGAGETAWSKLSAEEQAFGNTMGFTTPEAREKFAAEQLRLKGAAK